MQDEGLHEFQLNGKQLVFLFMAATVVAVVVFLCGVMVGRGVPQRAGAPSLTEQTVVDPTAAVQQAAPPLAVASTGTAPITAGETLTYTQRLEGPTPPVETLQPLAETAVLTQPAAAPDRRLAAAPPAPAAAKPAPAPAPPKPAPAAAKPAPAPAAPKPVPVPSPAPKPAAAAPPPPAAASAPSLAEPQGTGYVVQVAAVRKRAEADTIARRLSAKGYPTFVTTAGANFRVRVGKYSDRREAEAIAGRLEREERFKPWITR